MATSCKKNYDREMLGLLHEKIASSYPDPNNMLARVLSVFCELVSTRWSSVFDDRDLAGDQTPLGERR
jgi:hypothetical protein